MQNQAQETSIKKKQQPYLLVVVISLACLRVRVLMLINFEKIPIECKKMFLCSYEEIILTPG